MSFAIDKKLYPIMGKVEYKKLFGFLIFVENALYPNILSILRKVTLTPTLQCF